MKAKQHAIGAACVAGMVVAVSLAAVGATLAGAGLALRQLCIITMRDNTRKQESGNENVQV